MSLSENVRNTLMEVGQVAAEIPCKIDGCREFVSVCVTPSNRVMNFEARFPYFADALMLYRCFRFRVESELIEQDAHVGPDDLLALQDIYLTSENDVEFVLRIWKVSQDELMSPRYVEIPV